MWTIGAALPGGLGLLLSGVVSWRARRANRAQRCEALRFRERERELMQAILLRDAALAAMPWAVVVTDRAGQHVCAAPGSGSTAASKAQRKIGWFVDARGRTRHGLHVTSALIDRDGAALGTVSSVVDISLAHRLAQRRRADTERAAHARIDPAYLRALAGQGVNLRKLMREWRHTMHADIARTHEARKRNDADDVRGLLHRMGGALGLVGGPQATAFLDDAGQLDPTRLLDSVDAQLDRIERLMVAVHVKAAQLLRD